MQYWSVVYRTRSGLDEMHYPQFIVDWFGTKDRVQRWVAYLMLPGGLGLFAFRSLQALIQIVTGKRELMIAGHEAEELVAENRGVLQE